MMILNFLKDIVNNLDVKNLCKDKIFIGCLFIGLFISYILFNIITNTIKYPLIIILGCFIGKYIYNTKKKNETL